jgi:hypothetical protein
MLSRRETLFGGTAAAVLAPAAQAAQPGTWPAFPAEEIDLWPGSR